MKNLTFKQKFVYSLGAIPTGLLAFIFNLKYIEFFYNDLKLLPLFFIIGQVIYATVNAFNDPLLGQLSDRTNRVKWGSRRLIYIKYGGPIWCLTFLLLWYPWSFDNQIVIFLHFVISICLFDTMGTLVLLVWMALLPEMTTDIGERNSVTFFAIVLGSIALVPFYFLIASLNLLSVTFQLIMIVAAIISSICLFIIVKVCKEKPEFQADESFTLWKSFKESIKRKSFLLYMAYNFCVTFLGSIAISYLFLYFMVLGTDPLISMVGFFLIYSIVGYSGCVVCLRLQPKWGMRKIMLRFGTIKVIGVFIIFYLMLMPGLELLIWLGLIWVYFFGGYGIFTLPLMFLSVDEDEVINGTRREGMFLGINALITKPASSLGPIIATILLALFGYIQGGPSTVQPASAFLGVKTLFLLIPAIASALGLVFIYFYPLDGDYLKDMQDKLEIIHKTKKELSNLATSNKSSN